MGKLSEQEWLSIFSDNLRELLYARNMTQIQLSEQTGISQAAISRYLSKERMPSVKAIVNIAYALHCNFRDLIDFGDRIEG